MKTLHGVLALLLLPIIAEAQQIRVTLNVAANPSPYLSDWTSRRETAIVTIVNSDSKAHEVRLAARVLTDGELRAETKLDKMPVLTVSPGLNTFFAEDIIQASAVSFAGDVSSSVVRSGRLPSGAYTFCLRAHDASTLAPLGEEQCRPFRLQSYTPPRAMSPANGAHLLKPRSPLMFTWSDVAPRYSARQQYEIMVVEVLPGQSVSGAYRANRPILNRQLAATRMTWPSEVPIDTPMTYVWSVRALDDAGNPLGESPDGWAEPSVVTIGDTGAVDREQMPGPRHGLFQSRYHSTRSSIMHTRRESAITFMDDAPEMPDDAIDTPGADSAARASHWRYWSKRHYKLLTYKKITEPGDESRDDLRRVDDGSPRSHSRYSSDLNDYPPTDANLAPYDDGALDIIDTFDFDPKRHGYLNTERAHWKNDSKSKGRTSQRAGEIPGSPVGDDAGLGVYDDDALAGVDTSGVELKSHEYHVSFREQHERRGSESKGHTSQPMGDMPGSPDGDSVAKARIHRRFWSRIGIGRHYHLLTYNYVAEPGDDGGRAAVLADGDSRSVSRDGDWSESGDDAVVGDGRATLAIAEAIESSRATVRDGALVLELGESGRLMGRALTLAEDFLLDEETCDRLGLEFLAIRKGTYAIDRSASNNGTVELAATTSSIDVELDGTEIEIIGSDDPTLHMLRRVYRTGKGEPPSHVRTLTKAAGALPDLTDASYIARLLSGRHAGTKAVHKRRKSERHIVDCPKW